MALEHHVGEDGNGGVAHHAVGLAAHEVPHGQLALLAVDMDEGLGHVGQAVGVDERHERMGGAVGVPERERGVVGEGAVVHLAIGATVVAIDIGEDRGRRHGVVEGGVEDAALREVGGLDGDPAQRLVPRLVGEGHLVAEVPSGQLGLAVGLGVVDADGRQSDLHQERLRHIGGGDEPSAAVHRLNSDGLRELGGEEHLLIVGPSLG